MDKYIEIDNKNYLQTFERFPVVFEKGKGRRLWDTDGKEYLDLLGGIAVNNIGYSHPKHVDRISKQAEKLMHISNFFLTKPQVELTKKLVEISGMDRVFLANSGAEAVEGAIKVARKYSHSKGKEGTIISMEGSFHGRTLGTIATGKKKMQEGFDPIPGGFKQFPFNDIEAIRSTIDNDTGGILLELIQGEGGINVIDKDYIND